MLNRMYNKLEPLSPEYDEDCLNCAQPGRWSSAWMLIGLSNLLNLPIKSVYPAVDSTTSRGFKVLNHLFKPPFSDPEKGSLTIMWTNTAPPPPPPPPQKYTDNRRRRPGHSWLPNHFVPLVNRRPTDVYVPKVPKEQSLSQCEIAVSNDPKENLLFESPNPFVVLSEDTSIEPPREETEVSMEDPIEETIHVPVCQRRSKSPKTASPGEVKTHNISIIKKRNQKYFKSKYLRKRVFILQRPIRFKTIDDGQSIMFQTDIYTHKQHNKGI